MTRGHLNTDLKGVRGQATVTYRQRITSASAMALRWGLPGMFEGQREGAGREGEEVRGYGNGVDQMRPCLRLHRLWFLLLVPEHMRGQSRLLIRQPS